MMATVLLASLLGACLAALFGLAWYIANQVIQRRAPDAPATPADLGLDYEPVVFTSRDGLHLGGWLVNAPSPVRGTIILCHGHSGSMDPDLKYVPALHQRGYQVLQFDFRGHGRSEGQHVSMGYYERLDLLAAVDHLQSRGIEQVGVLGFSMGGAVALSTAAQCPAIAAVVSDGGFSRLRSTLQTGIQQRGLPGWLATIASPLIIRITNWQLGCNLTDADPQRWIDEISPRPVLLIHGGQDLYVPQAEIEALYGAARNPKEIWIVPEAGHRQIDEIYPQEYTARVLDFFDRWLAAKEEIDA